ncbi:MAG TPA: universal stress protein [Solirubrobacteraceae bacterium]|nr:universal stress protein [Solirubrobacteraceae bacterium]
MADHSPGAQQLGARSARLPGGPSVVLAGYDRSDASGHALAYAAGLAARVGARLVVLNVNESLALDGTIGVPPCVEDIAEEVQEVVTDCPTGCEVAVDIGDPATVIRRIASELHADLIVVGQSRHRWMHPLGSTPARLAHHAEQPVLVVP